MLNVFQSACTREFRLQKKFPKIEYFIAVWKWRQAYAFAEMKASEALQQLGKLVSKL